jgi:hypothetical protein
MRLTPPNRARLQATLAGLTASVVWWGFTTTWAAVVALVLFALAVLAWIAPSAYAPVQCALDRAARALAAAFTWFVLALVYFGLFMPLRLWRTLRRQDPLGLRRSDRPVSTFLRPMIKPGTVRRFERQF